MKASERQSAFGYKRALSLLLAVLMIASAFPAAILSAFAEPGEGGEPVSSDTPTVNGEPLPDGTGNIIIEGRVKFVYDDEGIGGASVSILKDGKLGKTVTTSDGSDGKTKGYFKVSMPRTFFKGSKYEFTASADGYVEKTVLVSLSGDNLIGLSKIDSKWMLMRVDESENLVAVGTGPLALNAGESVDLRAIFINPTTEDSYSTENFVVEPVQNGDKTPAYTMSGGVFTPAETGTFYIYAEDSKELDGYVAAPSDKLEINVSLSERGDLFVDGEGNSVTEMSVYTGEFFDLPLVEKGEFEDDLVVTYTFFVKSGEDLIPLDESGKIYLSDKTTGVPFRVFDACNLHVTASVLDTNVYKTTTDEIDVIVKQWDNGGAGYSVDDSIVISGGKYMFCWDGMILNADEGYSLMLPTDPDNIRKQLTFDVTDDHPNNVSFYVINDALSYACLVNETYEVDLSSPVVTVTFHDVNGYKDADSGKYFAKSREATVTFNGYEGALDTDAATQALKDAVGEKAIVDNVVWNSEKSQYISKVVFPASDAPYSFAELDLEYLPDIAYSTSFAENDNHESFYVDQTVPFGKLTAYGYNNETAFDQDWTVDFDPDAPDTMLNRFIKLISGMLDFNFFSNKPTEVYFTSDDERPDLSGIASVESIVRDVENEAALTEETIVSPDLAWTLCEKNSTGWLAAGIDPDSQVQVYVKVTDNVGNVTYIGTDGLVIDGTGPVCTYKVETEPYGQGTDEEENTVNIYNDDQVEISFTVKDKYVFEENESEVKASGIEQIRYEITGTGCEKESGVIYTSDGNEGRIFEKTGTVTIDSEKFNAPDVRVTFYVTDKAGNEVSYPTEKLDIDNSSPSVSLTYEDEKGAGNSGEGYFRQRVAVIEFKESGRHFSQANAEAAISAAVTYEPGFTFDWESTGSSADSHTVRITFNKDGELTWGDFEYTNLAGLTCSVIEPEEGSETPGGFTIDTIAPGGTATVHGVRYSGEEADPSVTAANAAIEEGSRTVAMPLLFKLITQESVSAGFKPDEQSGNVVVDYAVVRVLSNTPVDPSSVDNDAWTRIENEVDGEYPTAVIDEAAQDCFIFRVTDEAGNITYFVTDVFIIDRGQPTGILNVGTDPSAEIDGRPVYNGDVTVNYTFKDKTPDGESETDVTSSGIASVSYEITATGCETVSGTVDLQIEEGERIFEKSGVLTVSSEKFNAPDVTVTFTVTDLSGRTGTFECGPFDIDKNDLSVTASYTDVKGPGYNSAGTGFFKQRVATVVFTETDRHFDTALAEAAIEAALSVEPNYTSAWSTDGDKHTVEITFDADGEVIWDQDAFEYVNLAGNTCSSIVFAEGSETPETFTIDNGSPAGKVTLTGNDFREGQWTEEVSADNAAAETGVQTVSTPYTFTRWSGDTVIPVLSDISDENGDLVVDYAIIEVGEEDIEPDPAAVAAENWITISDPYVIPKLASGSQKCLIIRITDKAGNITYLCTDVIIVENNTPTVELKIETAPSVAETNIFNTDVVLKYSVSDLIDDSKVAVSGIQSIRFVISSESLNKTVTVDKYTFEDGGERVFGVSDDSITIDAAEFNAPDVNVKLIVIDLAGNEFTVVGGLLDIDKSTPEVSVSYSDAKGDGSEYYATEGFFKKRVATVVFTDTARHFDSEIAEASIASALSITPNYTSEWVTEGNKHTIRITFDSDGPAAWSQADFSYTDKAANTCSAILFAEGSETPENFTIDNVSPAGKVTLTGNDFRTENWTSVCSAEQETSPENGVNLISVPFSFNLWSRESVTPVLSDVLDDNEGHVVHYAVVDVKKGDQTFTHDAAKDCEWVQIESANDIPGIAPDSQKCMIFRITDKAGNITYLCTDVIIVEDNAPEGNLTVTTAPSVSGTSIFNSDVQLGYKVSDLLNGSEIAASGIQKIRYTVSSASLGNKEKSEDLFVYSSSDGRKFEKEGTITVSSSEFNASDVVVVLTAVDLAGNSVEIDRKTLDIDVSAPEISVSLDGTKKNESTAGKYAERIAVVTIVERANHFDGAKASEQLSSSIERTFKGVTEKGTGMTLSAWSGPSAPTGTHSDPNASAFTVTITFSEDGLYSFEAEYTDDAANTGTAAEKSEFWVDNTTPSLNVTATGKNYTNSDGEDSEWVEKWEYAEKNLGKATESTSTLYDCTYRKWSRTGISISVEVADTASGVQSVMYAITDAKDGYKPDLKGLNWVALGKGGVSLPANNQTYVYFRVVDNAGNVSYAGTDAFVIDNKQISIKIDEVGKTGAMGDARGPSVKINIPNGKTPNLYNGSVELSVDVNDVFNNGRIDTYSGISLVTYEIRNNSTGYSETGVLTDNRGASYKRVASISGMKFTVNKDKFNSNDVLITVTATDNAGNVSKADVTIAIDVTLPAVSVTYDNNNPDAQYSEYFKETRTATIVLTERNFKADDFVFIVNGENVAGRDLSWNTVVMGDNGDATTHTATYTFDPGVNATRDYETEIRVTDMAGNSITDSDVSYGASVSPRKFTVDREIPVLSVAFTDAEPNTTGTEYYSAGRYAVVTVVEHNFDPSRFVVAGKDGTSAGWVTNGDVHTLTVYYAWNDEQNEEEFAFTYDFSDMAGNRIENTVNYAFTIDTIFPLIKVEYRVDGAFEELPAQSAHNGDIEIRITYGDTYINYEKVDVKLTDSTGQSFEKKISDYTLGEEGNYVRTITDLKDSPEIKDGIYDLTITVYDYAGNASSVTRKISVNRLSSTFALDDFLNSLIGNVYNSGVSNDVIITEVNVCPITETTITVMINGTARVLQKGVDFIVDSSNNGAGWYQNRYTINKDVFSSDGNYSIVIVSKDEAGNTVYNTTTLTGETPIEFNVDRTPPIITLTGFKDNEIINAESITAYIAYEDNLAIDKVVVLIRNEKGEKLFEDIFDMENGLDNNIFGTVEKEVEAYDGRLVIEVTAYDLAGNQCETVTRRVTVSTNPWVRFVNNPLAVGLTIGGVALVAVAAVVIPIIVKKKKNKK